MENESGTPGFASGSPSNLGDRLSSAAGDAKARVAGVGRKAADVADRARSSASAGLDTAAGAVEDAGSEGSSRAKKAARATADALATGADYIRENSVRDMVDDAVEVVKNNPGVALLAAVALGFVVGRAFSSRN
jgi:ElaB/YqjD/DUF883 family membrane-anchored ribosome-binding protein